MSNTVPSSPEVLLIRWALKHCKTKFLKVSNNKRLKCSFVSIGGFMILSRFYMKLWVSFHLYLNSQLKKKIRKCKHERLHFYRKESCQT